VAAALTSTTHEIAFIGGYDDSVIWTWHAGYEAGARAIDPDIQIASAYLSRGGDASGFHDAAAAEQEASRMYAAGADVVFHAAGDSGVGVFEAATALSTAERKLWAIGVDSDQYETVGSISGAVHPDEWRLHILTSVLKRVDLATHEFLAEYAQGEFRPGRHTFDLASGGMDISYSGHYIDDIAQQIDAAREGIMSGRISVPCVPVAKLALAQERGYPVDFCDG
jgi:basic membrane protein A